MSKLLAQDISVKDAVLVMKGLGCKVTYIEAPTARCVCVCVRERERERERLSVSVHVCASTHERQ